jgi:nucleoside-diphosphate-sugar epimerase
LPENSVHIVDIALAHIRALDPKISRNQSFLLAASTQGIIFDDAIEIAERNFPVIVEKGLMQFDGTFGTTKCLVDAFKAQKQLGTKFKSYEEQVKNVVGCFLKLSGEKGVPGVPGM